MPPKTVTELEIVIPKDKLNDLNFIYLKLMEVSLDTLHQICSHCEKNLVELVNEFIPELKNLDNDEFLSKWKLSKSILNNLAQSSQIVNETNTEKDNIEEPAKPKAVKKLKLAKKPKLKMKLKKPSGTKSIKTISKDNDTKPKVKKLKLGKKKLKLAKKV